MQGLGITGALYRTLRTTNPIENLNGAIARYTRNVKRWKDASMAQRWVASALHDAKGRFRTLRGHRDMKILIAVLNSHAEKLQADELRGLHAAASHRDIGVAAGRPFNMYRDNALPRRYPGFADAARHKGVKGSQAQGRLTSLSRTRPVDTDMRSTARRQSAWRHLRPFSGMHLWPRQPLRLEQSSRHLAARRIREQQSGQTFALKAEAFGAERRYQGFEVRSRIEVAALE